METLPWLTIFPNPFLTFFFFPIFCISDRTTSCSSLQPKVERIPKPNPWFGAFLIYVYTNIAYTVLWDDKIGSYFQFLKIGWNHIIGNRKLWLVRAYFNPPCVEWGENSSRLSVTKDPPFRDLPGSPWDLLGFNLDLPRIFPGLKPKISPVANCSALCLVIFLFANCY